MLENPSSFSVGELEIARGNVPGISLIRKFGRNPAVGGVEDVWTVGGVYPFPQAALPIRIRVGGNVLDVAGGLNARAITIQGLDGNFDEIEEVIITAGAAQSAETVASYFRVFRAFVTDVGGYGNTNAGDINIETNAGTLLARIGTGLGQTQMAIYTVPAGQQGFLHRLRVHVESPRAVDVNFFQRPNADVIVAPFGGVRLVSGFEQITGDLLREYDTMEPFEEKTDIWAQASNPTAATALSVEFDVWLVANG